MEIRLFQKNDDIYAISRIYEQSWKFAYKGIHTCRTAEKDEQDGRDADTGQRETHHHQHDGGENAGGKGDLSSALSIRTPAEKMR